MFGWTAKSFKNSFETFRPGLRCSRGPKTPRGWYFLSSVCVCSGAYCLTLVLMLACRMGSPFALQVCVTFLFTFPCPRRTISVRYKHTYLHTNLHACSVVVAVAVAVAVGHFT